MPSAVADSSFLYALFDADDRDHVRAAEFLRQSSDMLITNVQVLTEVLHLLSYSTRAQQSFGRFVVESVEIDSGGAEDLARAFEIMQKYADLPADFADASLVAMCERRGITLIATLDRDFDVYRLMDGTALTNVLRP